MLVLGYCVTLFVSALLLFLVQPMVGKMLLPLFGGTPAVWNTCMVFYQAALLGGYAYAHAAVRYLPLRRHALIHLLLMMLAMLALPIGLHGQSPSAADNPTAWLLVTLVLMVGPPFLLVSTSAPLIQRWFVETGHPAGHDPYFLYAAGNAGSLCGLLGYLLVFEPNLTLEQQSAVWAASFVLLWAMTAICAWTVLRPRHAQSSRVAVTATTDQSKLDLGKDALLGDSSALDEDISDAALGIPKVRDRLAWLFLAFVPSSLMLGATTHITTNLAPIPLLWVAPLACYLLTFVLVFARRQLIPHRRVARFIPMLMLATVPLMHISLFDREWLAIPIHLFTLFMATMLCHGALAARRPAAAYLTEFYLYLAAGGVLGGLFNAIVAPAVFTRILEYPLVMALACLALPVVRSKRNRKAVGRLDVLLPLALAAFQYAVYTGIVWSEIDNRPIELGLLLAPAALICYSFRFRPARFALGYGVIVATFMLRLESGMGSTLDISRNFFGMKQVCEYDEEYKSRELYHGTTLHGTQYVDHQLRYEPMTYYHRQGPAGDMFASLQDHGSFQHCAVIGLGVGSIAAYIETGQQVTFFEIDPDVVRIAEDPDLFTYLADCRGKYEIIVGDGRLRLAEQPPETFDVLIVDAFSSDAIPVHLLTREAVTMYLSRLTDDGLMAFHISNNYLNLEPLLSAIAEELGLQSLSIHDYKDDADDKDDPDAITATGDTGETNQKVVEADAPPTVADDFPLGIEGKSASVYVILARPGPVLDALRDVHGWTPAEHDPRVRVWTDHHSSILHLLD